MDTERVRDPNTVFYQSDGVRRSILASYWLVILLATPLWWYTTSIERLSLPSSRVLSQSQKELQLSVNILLDPPLVARNPQIATGLQEILDERIKSSPSRWKGLDVHVGLGSSHSKDTYLITSGEKGGIVKDRALSVSPEDYPLPLLADTLTTLLIPSTIPDRDQVVAQYSPRYRLAFTLLNEDAAAGQAVTGWDISDAMKRHIDPAMASLAVLHNFTVESQIQFHGSLAFNPSPVGDDAYGLTQEDLTVFVNSAEWTLSSSVTEDPVLHFVLFVPSSTRRPLHILNPDGTPSSNAFLLPQWGGIVIYNPPQDITAHQQLHSSSLDDVFSLFTNQLLTLLGVPRLPPGVHVHPQDRPLLSDWQLDALLRQRALENARTSKDTLRSTVKLVDQIENMPVGQYVRGDVEDALSALDLMHTASSQSLPETLYYSARANTLASRAFYHPGMLALLYFPAEHKYAVYTPLFASAVIPLFAAAVRELLKWRKQRQAEKGVREKEPQRED